MLPRSLIVIDAGHGGHADAGKSTAYGARGAAGTAEKDVTLRVATQLARRLGSGAVLTRDDDRNLPLAARCELARRAGAQVFVSLHADARVAGERGARSFAHARGSAASRALAASIDRQLGGRGAIESGELAVLAPERHAAHTAACLVEMDNLCDAGGERRLGDAGEIASLAHAIARGIEQFRGGAPRGHYNDARLGRGSVSAANNNPPRQGRREERRTDVESWSPTVYPHYPIPNNEVTFEFAASPGYTRPVDCEVTVTLSSYEDGAQLGRHSVSVVGDGVGYVTFTGSQADPIDPTCRIEIAVYNRINQDDNVHLRFSVWT